MRNFLTISPSTPNWFIKSTQKLPFRNLNNQNQTELLAKWAWMSFFYEEKNYFRELQVICLRIFVQKRAVNCGEYFIFTAEILRFNIITLFHLVFKRLSTLE